MKAHATIIISLNLNVEASLQGAGPGSRNTRRGRSC